jgi:hypothetical protein
MAGTLARQETRGLVGYNVQYVRKRDGRLFTERSLL